MDKAKIQLFSDTVREKLFSEIQQRAMLFGITAEKIFDVDQEFEDSIVINGKVFDKKNKAQQELQKINKQLEETVEYHKLLKNKGDQYIEIDLDDGVKVNYEKFKGLVAKI